MDKKYLLLRHKDYKYSLVGGSDDLESLLRKYFTNDDLILVKRIEIEVKER